MVSSLLRQIMHSSYLILIILYTVSTVYVNINVAMDLVLEYSFNSRVQRIYHCKTDRLFVSSSRNILTYLLQSASEQNPIQPFDLLPSCIYNHYEHVFT